MGEVFGYELVAQALKNVKTDFRARATTMRCTDYTT